MARIRTIKNEFFLDDELASKSAHARLLFVGLWTLSDREGRLEDKPARIKAQVFPFECADVESLLCELADGGFLQRYTVEGRNYIQVTNFLKHQLYQTPGFADKLRSINAANLAVDLKPEAKDERLSRFVDGLPDTPSWNPSENDPHFLGNEFMLWLWHRAENGDDTLTLSDESEVAYMFSGGIKLDCPRGNLGNDTLNHESAIRLPEARAAARSGKLPRKAALTVVRHDNQFSFKFDAETFGFGSARLPKPDAMGTREQHEQRLGWLRDLGETIDLMYQAFLARRLSSYWEAELRDIRAWLGQAEAVTV